MRGFSCCGSPSRLADLAHARLQIILLADLLDQSQLFFDPVDVFFFALLDTNQQFARHVIADRLAVRDRVLVDRMRFLFTTKVAFQDFPDRSEEHTSELQSLMRISYAVFCLKKKNTN